MPRIAVTVIPKSSKAAVEEMSALEYRVHLTKAPADGEANAQLVSLLSKHFGVAKSLIRIVRGATGRKKIIELS